jgi:nitrite reductase/ring-hydroxylating ferredoxin subunit
MSEQFQPIAKLADLPEGELCPKTAPDGVEVVLVRIGEQVFAVSPLCTHQDAWLDAGWAHPESLEVECPLHGGKFDLRSGNPTQEPPTAPISTYQTRVEGDEVFLGPVKS